MKIQKSKNLQLSYTQIATALGRMYLLASSSHLLGITVTRQDLNKLALKFGCSSPKNKESELLRKTENQLSQYFKGSRKHFSLPIKVEGTSFQKIAWKVLTRIPYGKTISYSEQAIAASNPKAIRAIGSANGKNPLPIIIPCHRVTAKGDALGGYSLGLSMKKKLIALEKS